MKPILTMPLNQALDLLYNVNPEAYLDSERYQFELHHMPVDKYSKEHFEKVYRNMSPIKELGELKEINTENQEQIIKLAMLYRQEESYPQDVYKKVIEYGIEAIEKDFKDANDNIMYDDIQFDLYMSYDSDEAEKEIEQVINEQKHIIKQSVSVKVNQETNNLEFYGSLEKLAYIVIASIHGYGSFRFNSLQEFCDKNEGYELSPEELGKTIIDHLHWLNQWNKIYGDGIFVFGESEISNRLNYVYSLGDYDFTEEHILLAVDNLFIYA